MTVDKNQAVIDYLLECTDVNDSPVYFNLINAEDNAIQIITTAEDKATQRAYIDGSVRKMFTFNLVIFKSISDMEIVKIDGYANENVDELRDVQKLIDWVHEQNDLRNFPNFGESCVIDSIDTTTDVPRFDGINTEINPPLAMYSVSITIDYVDESKIIYK